MKLRDVQSRLAAAHLDESDIDGLLGGLTNAAVKAFLLQQGVLDFGAGRSTASWSPPSRSSAASTASMSARSTAVLARRRLKPSVCLTQRRTAASPRPRVAGAGNARTIETVRRKGGQLAIDRHACRSAAAGNALLLPTYPRRSSLRSTCMPRRRWATATSFLNKPYGVG